MIMIAEYSFACCKGKTREVYEDNYYFFGNISENGRDEKLTTVTDETATIAVFDGVGGMSHGEIASRIAAATLKSTIKDAAPANSGELSKIFNLINLKLCDAMNGTNLKFGTTAALATINNGVVHLCNIGDSPVFLIRDNEITQISVDHIEQKNVERLNNTADANNVKRGLTQYLGIAEDEMILEPYTATVQIKAGDILLICTDGLTNILDPETVKNTVNSSRSPAFVAADLMDEAMLNGGTDNITIICVSVRG